MSGGVVVYCHESVVVVARGAAALSRGVRPAEPAPLPRNSQLSLVASHQLPFQKSDCLMSE